MINLIKMDLYRMVHSICTWVMLLVTVGIALFCVAMVNIDLEDMAENPQYSEETSQMGIVSFQIEVKTQDAQEETEETENSEEEQQIGLYADSDPGWIEGQILAGDLISTQLESGILTLLCVIFAAIFFNGDQRNGFLKNIAGQYPNRGILVISKMTAAAVQILLMEIVFAIATGVTAEIIWGEQFVLGSSLRCFRSLRSVSPESGSGRADPAFVHPDQERGVWHDSRDPDDHGDSASRVFGD